MKLSALFRGGAVATLVAAMLIGCASRQAAAVETKSAKADTKMAKKVEKIDLNKATSAQLEALPGVGAATAKKIIAGRPYKSVDDLSKAGVSAAEIRKLTSLV